MIKIGQFLTKFFDQDLRPQASPWPDLGLWDGFAIFLAGPVPGSEFSREARAQSRGNFGGGGGLSWLGASRA